MEQENPLDIGFCASLRLNGVRLHPSDGCGMGYLPGTDAGSDEAAALVHYYGLDETKVWRFWRNSYPWSTKSRKSRPKRFRTLELELEAELEQHLAEQFPTPAAGGVGDDPRTGKRECRLSIDGAGCPVGNAGAPGLRRLGTSKLFLHDDVPSDAESGTLLPDRLRRGRSSAPQTTEAAAGTGGTCPEIQAGTADGRGCGHCGHRWGRWADCRVLHGARKCRKNGGSRCGNLRLLFCPGAAGNGHMAGGI